MKRFTFLGTISLVCFIFLILAGLGFAAEKVELTWWGNAQDEPRMNKWAEAYMEYDPNGKVEVSVFPEGAFTDKFWTAVATVRGPDLGSSHQYFIYSLYRAGLIVPYPEDLANKLKDLYYGMEDFNLGGKYYAWPIGTDYAPLYSNKDILEEAGMGTSWESLPQTWEELRQVAKKLTKRDQAGDITQAGFAFNERTNGIFWSFMYQQGGRIMSEDGKKYVFNSPEAVNVYKYLYELDYVDKVNSPDFLTYREAFGSQRAAFTWCFSWFGNYLDSNYPEINWVCSPSPVPSLENFYAFGTRGHTTNFTILKKSKEKVEAALKMVEFIAPNDDLMLFATKYSFTAPRKKSLVGHPDFQTKDLKVGLAVAPYSIFSAESEQLPVYSDILPAVEYKILREQKDIQETLDWAVEKANAWLSEENPSGLIINEYGYEPPESYPLPH